MLVIFQLAAMLLGWAWIGPWGAAAGSLLGAMVWSARDQRVAMRLLQWLKAQDSIEPPKLRSTWSEVAHRARRWLRASEQQRQASEARLQDFLAAIQVSPNGVVLLDSADRIEWCNQTAAQHLGVDAQQDLMQFIGNLVRDPAFTAYLNEAGPDAGLVIPGRQDSPGRPVRIALQLHAYGEGRRMMLTRDVTALEQADAMRRDFVANVSHEIRTPLTVLSGFVETLQTLHLEAKERERYLALMAQQATRMQTLVDDLLILSKLEGSPAPAQGQWFALAPLLERCALDARNLAQMSVLDGKTSHELVFNLNSVDDAQLDGSFNELLSAFSNLLSNAIRYTPPGGRVEMSWRLLEDGGASFEVKDSGPGIAAEHLPRLTERFYRVDQSRSRQTGGTGLGLAIVKHVVQRHGARLHIESELGKGSTFSIELPAQRCRGARP